MNSAIMKFGEMLTHSHTIAYVGTEPPIFSWGASGDIVIMGTPPEDFNGRVCSVKVPDEETPLFTRLYRDGNKVILGYMDDYDVWKSYPAENVTVLGEVLAVVHLYGPMERPKAETAWEKRVKRAVKDAIGKFTYKDYEQLQRHYQSGRTFDALAAAFSIGYQAGKKEAGTQ